MNEPSDKEKGAIRALWGSGLVAEEQQVLREYIARVDRELREWERAGQDVVDLFDPFKPSVSPALLKAVAQGVKTANTDLRAKVLAAGPVSEGHDEPCYYCKRPCNCLAGNPGEWSIGLPHADDPGVVKWHHVSCILERLLPTGTVSGLEGVCRKLEDFKPEGFSIGPLYTAGQTAAYTEVAKWLRKEFGLQKEGETS
jgi:hypothetical protein